ncbi:MAG: TetR/AcrR family transcriptional regulator [Polyangiales bacterium]
MAERRRPTELRQVELIDAALHILATRGIAALSTRSLAAQVGLSSGAIFRHFASIDALFEAVVARVESVLEATYPDEALSPRERLGLFVEARSAAVGSQRGIMQLVLSEQFLLALPKGAAARLGACVLKTREFVSRCLREGQAAGEFRDDLDASALAVLVLGTIQMLALSAARRLPLAAPSPLVRETLDALLRSAPQSPRAKGPLATRPRRPPRP